MCHKRYAILMLPFIRVNEMHSRACLARLLCATLARLSGMQRNIELQIIIKEFRKPEVFMSNLCFNYVVYAAANVRTVYATLPYDQRHAPIVGPSNPYTKDGLAAGVRNHRAGHVEVGFHHNPVYISDFLSHA